MEGKSMKVNLGGDLAGEYIVGERYEDGSVLLGPDTSMGAIVRRLGIEGRLATPEEHKEAYGHLPRDGEG